jgi:tetratricopeptide (TPR) repeat protein
VTFYLAHEQRELGEFETMLKTLGDLVRKFPSSPLRLDSEQILGDYWFDKADLKQAEDHYRAILDAPPSPVHDLRATRWGGFASTSSNHAEAVTFFEAAAASAPLPGADLTKALDGQARGPARPRLLATPRRARPRAPFSTSRSSRTRAPPSPWRSTSCANRYFIKQQYEFAIPALAHACSRFSPTPSSRSSASSKLYDSLKAAEGQGACPSQKTWGCIVRAAAQVKTRPHAATSPAARRTLAELEEMARDLSTTVHVPRPSEKDDKAALHRGRRRLRDATSALFRPEGRTRPCIMQNRADALYRGPALSPTRPGSSRSSPPYLDIEVTRTNRGGAGDKTEPAADPNRLDVSQGPEGSAPKDAPKDAAAPKAQNGTEGRQARGRRRRWAHHGRAATDASVSRSRRRTTTRSTAPCSPHFSALKPGEVERLTAFEVADARQALKLLGAAVHRPLRRRASTPSR